MEGAGMCGRYDDIFHRDLIGRVQREYFCCWSCCNDVMRRVWSTHDSLHERKLKLRSK
jgi:hypothetical protein